MLISLETLFCTYRMILSLCLTCCRSELCNPALRYEFYRCPACDSACDFRYLTDSCVITKLTKVFDHVGTVAFAIFMSFWGKGLFQVISNYKKNSNGRSNY